MIALLMLQLVSTFGMVGVIWFVQVVHYPLFGKVGNSGFREYEREHQRRTTFVVAPLMLTEALTAAALLWIRPDGIPPYLAVAGLGLGALLWASTFLWQVPAHERLAKSFDSATHLRLVRSNWFRTVAWSTRGVLVCWMCLRLLSVRTDAVAHFP